jgi:flagellar hook assembly protein FlgD
VIQGWAASQVRTSVAASPPERSDADLAVSPNPASGPVALRCSLPAASAGASAVAIADVTGRLVREIWQGAAPPGGGLTLGWDGRDSRGALVPQGIYYARVTGSWGELARPVVIIR